MKQQVPTPNPIRIEDRGTYEFRVTVEGANIDMAPGNAEEANALANEIRGLLGKHMSTRWTSVTATKWPALSGDAALTATGLTAQVLPVHEHDEFCP